MTSVVFDVRFDAKRAIARLEAYRGDLTERYIAQALNRTADYVKTRAVRAIADELRPLKQKVVREAIRIQRANKTQLFAVVQARGRKLIPLPLLRAKQTKSGVRVRVGSQSFNIAHAFQSKIKGGRLGIRIRAPGFRAQLVTATEYRAKRVSKTGMDFPVAEILAPGIPTKFVQRRIIEIMRRAARERFAVVLEQQIKRAATGG